MNIFKRLRYLIFNSSYEHDYEYQSEEKSENFYYLALLKNADVVYGASIHGLWPNYANGSYPSFCKNVEFDFDKLSPIIKELRDYWDLPGDIGKDEISFWQHEYKKHGSCMFIELTELEYFKKALELYFYIMENGIDIEKYRKGKNYMIPFDLDFKLSEK
jgi:ribonuclease I|tara:strand:- start:7110 stop:7589 length:480 start_codon:yes stop_codon:yes gene_type:complete